MIKRQNKLHFRKMEFVLSKQDKYRAGSLKGSENVEIYASES